MLSRIKLKYIWISILLVFALAVGLIIWASFSHGALTTVILVLLAISFIYLTIAIQYASYRTFRYKSKNIYNTITYESIVDDYSYLLTKKGFKGRMTPYGVSYLKIDGKIAYKVSLINSSEIYFNDENKDSNTPLNKQLDKCEKFIGFELFLDYKSEDLDKISLFTFTGDKIYYTAFVYNKNIKSFECLNYETPSEEFKPYYDSLLEYLEFNKKEVD